MSWSWRVRRRVVFGAVVVLVVGWALVSSWLVRPAPSGDLIDRLEQVEGEEPWFSRPDEAVRKFDGEVVEAYLSLGGSVPSVSLLRYRSFVGASVAFHRYDPTWNHIAWDIPGGSVDVDVPGRRTELVGFTCSGDRCDEWVLWVGFRQHVLQGHLVSVDMSAEEALDIYRPLLP